MTAAWQACANLSMISESTNNCEGQVVLIPGTLSLEDLLKTFRADKIAFETMRIHIILIDYLKQNYGYI